MIVTFLKKRSTENSNSVECTKAVTSSIVRGKTKLGYHKENSEKVYFRFQILERPSIGEYWNILGVPVLAENVIFRFFRMCWCYSEAYNTGMQKLFSIVQYSCTSIWDLKYTFSENSTMSILHLLCSFSETERRANKKQDELNQTVAKLDQANLKVSIVKLALWFGR